MRFGTRIRSWLRVVVHRLRAEREMDAELRFHIQAFAEDLVRGGLSREEAQRRHASSLAASSARKRSAATLAAQTSWKPSGKICVLRSACCRKALVSRPWGF